MSGIKTYTGVMFDPVSPDPDLIDIVDIAHALSMLCRSSVLLALNNASGSFYTGFDVLQL